jgi:pimeloyl-ACP methyl ester carboxylesterase
MSGRKTETTSNGKTIPAMTAVATMSWAEPGSAEAVKSGGDGMEIDRREPVQLGESTQWIRIRAANNRNPLLLLVQQGPGLPMINEARAFERVLPLEDDFTVIYWDQRGCGRSLRSSSATRELSIQTMVSDTERLLAMLCDRFDMPAVVAGFSLGATIAALAAARRPDLVATLVAVGMDVDGAAAGRSAYEFVLTTAQARKNRRAIRQLEAIGPPPHLEPEKFATRARWVANFGGVRTGHTYNSQVRSLLFSLLRSPDYSLADAVRTIRGITAARAALLPELEALDLTHTLSRLNCPIVMVQGRHDQVAPTAFAERYAESLEAPHKQLVWFEHSAHMPHLEEPARFRKLLTTVRLGLPANA